jgi:lipopolysaccharide heptosyltransferase II
VDWYLSVLSALGVPVHKNFVWLPARPQVAAEVERKWNGVFKHQASSITHAAPRLIALQPGARWQNKRWPIEHFAELVRQLAKQFPGTPFVILGGKDEQLLGDIISQGAPGPCLNLCGQTSLLEMVEWIRRCDLLVTNDTGPMHAAAALGKPLVALFGPTEPRRTGPYGQLENVLHLDLPCSPCLKSVCHFDKPEECLRALVPALVLAHIRKLLI